MDRLSMFYSLECRWPSMYIYIYHIGILYDMEMHVWKGEVISGFQGLKTGTEHFPCNIWYCIESHLLLATHLEASSAFE